MLAFDQNYDNFCKTWQWKVILVLTVLTGTRHKLTPARQAGAPFIYPGRMEGWVDLRGWLPTKMVYPPTRRSPIQLQTGPDVRRSRPARYREAMPSPK